MQATVKNFHKFHFFTTSATNIDCKPRLYLRPSVRSRPAVSCVPPILSGFHLVRLPVLHFGTLGGVLPCNRYELPFCTLLCFNEF